jgi:hypothetical protein
MPQGTRASPKIQADVTEIISVLDSVREVNCDQRIVANREVVKRATEENYAAVERWTLDRCGKMVRYLITFKPGSSGGVDFTVKPEE